MPFEFKKKNKRREIPKEIILRAIEEITKGAKIKATANKYDIPRSNLQRYLKQGTVKDVSSKFISCQIFAEDEEAKLSEYLITSSKLNYGLSKVQTRQLAYDYACAINKKIPEHWTKNKKASKD
ncbi:unnamed protein product [Arctia plantaginis]|uniref:HTH psq-type domain-containing protein n=1 Tax=Arctia plantaginis TaxID=874455 RepID=A0A8S1B588_ARCPL|nr:unnamed protein product [Arctia plantaginis]